MLVKTKYFGEVEIDDSKILNFEYGIPGVLEYKKYTVITEDDMPFSWLQCVENSEIAFVIMDVKKIIPDYDAIEIYRNDKALDQYSNFGEFDDDDIVVYNIAVIPEDVEKMSVNLKAPVFINVKTKESKQIILSDEKLPIRYYFYEKFKKGGEQEC